MLFAGIDDGDDQVVDLAALIASAADVCRKPLRHAVIARSSDSEHGDPMPELVEAFHRGDDLILKLECRDPGGARCADDDLELEIYRSGTDVNLMLAWCHQPERPLLWQGQHPVWMDAGSGRRCAPPLDAAPLEALSRRLRALLRPSAQSPL